MTESDTSYPEVSLTGWREPYLASVLPHHGRRIQEPDRAEPTGSPHDAGELRSPHPSPAAFDVQIGGRIRERRTMLGMSQQQLAQLIGVTYQQTHKYERGMNRISAARLYDVARVLGVPVAWFFEDLAPSDPAEVEERSVDRLGLELARCFARISDAGSRAALAQMARALANETTPHADAAEPEAT